MWPLLKAPGPALPLAVALTPGPALALGCVCVCGGGGGAGRREIGKKRRSTSYFLFRGELPSVAEAESSQSL